MSQSGNVVACSCADTAGIVFFRAFRLSSDIVVFVAGHQIRRNTGYANACKNKDFIIFNLRAPIFDMYTISKFFLQLVLSSAL